MSNIAQFRPPEVVREDTDLVQRLRGRDPDALGRLVDRFDERLHTVARCLGVESAGAEAVTIETFVGAWRDPSVIEPGDDVAPWVARLLEMQLAGVVESGDVSLDDRISIVWTVADSVATLDPTDQRIIHALQVEGRGADEVAPAVSLTSEEVVGRSARAHQRLARRLQHLGGQTETFDTDESWVDVRGRPTAQFTALVGEQAASVIADPALWAPAPDHVLDEVLAAAGVDAPGRSASERTADDDPVVDHSAPRPSRWRQVRAGLIGGALTIAFLTAGIVAFSAAGEPPATATFEADLVPTGLVPDVEGTLEVTELDGGLEIALDAPTLPRRVQGSFYEGWLRLDDDRLVPIGTFQTGIDVTLFAGVDLEDVTELVIAFGEALPDGGMRSGPEDVVLKADIPPPGS